MSKKQQQLPVRIIRGGSHTLGDRGLVPVQFACTAEVRNAARGLAGAAGLSLSVWLRQLVETAVRKNPRNLPDGA